MKTSDDMQADALTKALTAFGELLPPGYVCQLTHIQPAYLNARRTLSSLMLDAPANKDGSSPRNVVALIVGQSEEDLQRTLKLIELGEQVARNAPHLLEPLSKQGLPKSAA